MREFLGRAAVNAGVMAPAPPTSTADMTGPASVYSPIGEGQARRAQLHRRARVGLIVLFALALQVAFAAIAARYLPSLTAPTTAAVDRR